MGRWSRRKGDQELAATACTVSRITLPWRNPPSILTPPFPRRSSADAAARDSSVSGRRCRGRCDAPFARTSLHSRSRTSGRWWGPRPSVGDGACRPARRTPLRRPMIWATRRRMRCGVRRDALARTRTAAAQSACTTSPGCASTGTMCAHARSAASDCRPGSWWSVGSSVADGSGASRWSAGGAASSPVGCSRFS